MKKIGVSFLFIYTAIIIAVERIYSWRVAEHLFANVEGPVPFYAVNTSLSVFLMWATALLFMITIVTMDKESRKGREYWFYVSQVLMFVFLGADDRFLFHIMVGNLFSLNYSLILMAIGFIQFLLLICLGEIQHRRKLVRLYLYFGAMLFLLQMIIDIVSMRGHSFYFLCVEDLVKLWGAFFLFLYAWEICYEKIIYLRNNQLRRNFDTLKFH